MIIYIMKCSLSILLFLFSQVQNLFDIKKNRIVDFKKGFIKDKHNSTNNIKY